MPDLRRVRRVEHMQLRIARLGAESLGKYFGPEARTTHAEQQHIPEFRALDVLGELLEVGDPLQLLVDDVPPTKPIGLIRLGPQRGVRGPQPPYLALLAPVLDGCLDVLLQLV